MGIGDWGLGIGDWGLVPIPNPQSPIPNPQSPLFLLFIFKLIYKKNNKFIKIIIYNIMKYDLINLISLFIKLKININILIFTLL